MSAWEWLHSKVNPLVSLQIVISVKALRALIAFERSIIRYRLMMLLLLLLIVVVQVLGIRSVPTVELWHHSLLHVADHRHLVARTMDIRHNGTLHSRKGV